MTSKKSLSSRSSRKAELMLDSKSFHLRQNFSAVAMADLKGLKFAEMIPMSSFCPFSNLLQCGPLPESRLLFTDSGSKFSFASKRTWPTCQLKPAERILIGGTPLKRFGQSGTRRATSPVFCSDRTPQHSVSQRKRRRRQNDREVLPAVERF